MYLLCRCVVARSKVYNEDEEDLLLWNPMIAAVCVGIISLALVVAKIVFVNYRSTKRWSLPPAYRKPVHIMMLNGVLGTLFAVQHFSFRHAPLEVRTTISERVNSSSFCAEGCPIDRRPLSLFPRGTRGFIVPREMQSRGAAFVWSTPVV